MQPEVAEALPRLRERGVVRDPPASRLLRVARGDLVSVRFEIRTLLYLGVLLLATGLGLFVKEHHERIGPAAIASAIGLAAASLACVEVQFRLFGAKWPYQLLVVALLSGAAAFRWDSPVALSLALSSFAAF